MSDDSERRRIEDLAGNGDVQAQIFLGWAHDRHGDYEYDRDRAERWLRAAAKSRDEEALRRLCRFLDVHGRDEAVSLADELINRGDFCGHYLKGHMLLDGRCGLTADKEAGLAHLRTAGEMGHLISEIDFWRRGSPHPFLNPVTLSRLLALSARMVVRMCHDPASWTVYR
jgi:hypothetical protein